MTQSTTVGLLKLKKEVLQQVDGGQLGIQTAATLLGMTRQGLWKLRKNFRRYGNQALVGRKRGPIPGIRIHNRTPVWAEDAIGDLYDRYGVGPTKLLWIIADFHHAVFATVPLSRTTVYRILVRRRQIIPKNQKRINHHTKQYAKGYPGEEVQIDTTEPFGKGTGTLISIVDDHSRWAGAWMYTGNTSRDTSAALHRYIESAPFPVHTVRTDNGSEFKKDFQRYCQENDIQLIRNPIKTPEHNGKVERLHRTIEEECLWRLVHMQTTDLPTATYELQKYMQWYNTTRRHQGYGMQGRTPQQTIEDWILNNPSPFPFTAEVNETLVLYTI